MATWTSGEIAVADQTDEIEIASYRADGSLRPYVTVWMVTIGESLYVRSAYGPENGWYRRARASGTGRVRFGGVERDVGFVIEESDIHSEIDARFHAKYDRFGARTVNPVVSEESHATTLRLEPRE